MTVPVSVGFDGVRNLPDMLLTPGKAHRQLYSSKPEEPRLAWSLCFRAPRHSGAVGGKAASAGRAGPNTSTISAAGSGRAFAIGLTLTACTPSAEPSPLPSPTSGSIVFGQIAMRDDADPVATIQQRLLSPPPLPGHVHGHGWAGRNLYSIGNDGTCAAQAALVQELVILLRANGATTTRCAAAASFAPNQPASLPRDGHYR